MMREQSQALKRSKLYEAYREYVEFLSQLRITQPFASILQSMSSVIMLTDLLYLLAPNDTFIRQLAYLGISTAIMETVTSASSIVFYLLAGKIILLLLSPIIALVTMGLSIIKVQKYRNGVFKQIYQDSFINCTLRSFLGTFVLIFLPLFASLSAKFIQLGEGYAVLGSAILALALLNGLLVEIHTFDFESHNREGLVAVNYPYRMIDDLLITLGLIAINTSGVLGGELLGMFFIGLRLALSVYFPFYFDRSQKVHQATLIAVLITAFAVFVSQFGEQLYLFLIIAAALLGLLVRTRAGMEEVEWQALAASQGGDQLGQLRLRLFKDKSFVRVYRELILLSRKNNSHRSQLQIQILKSKCTQLQALNRGGVTKSSVEDVIRLEQNVVRFLQNFLRAAELSVSIFKLMQHREGRKQVLAQKVQQLMGYLVQDKVILRKILELNEYSQQVKFLLLKVYAQFYQDGDFVKETEKLCLEAQESLVQKQLKEKFFSDKTTVVFVNILEQIGKIVKVSKNLPRVLGFLPSNLIGLPITEIIPFTIRPFHDSNLLNFVARYTDKDSYSSLDLQFYAYNSDFHLQQVRIYYGWIMTDFHDFLLAGAVEKIQVETNVILTDQWGFLEGWTRKIGSEELNLDEISIGQRKNFNIFPLFPSLIKYIDSMGVYSRTLFFKNQKSRDNNLMVAPCTGEGEDEMRSFQQRLLGTFRKMLKEQEFVGMFFAEVEMTQLRFCAGRAKMLRFVIKNFDRVQNFSDISAMIQTLSFSNNSNPTEKQLADPTNGQGEGSEKQQLSIFSEEERADRRIDSNFTLNPQGSHIFPLQQLVFGQFNASRTSFELNNIYDNHINRRRERQEKRNSSNPQNNFNPILYRSTSLFLYALIVSVAAFVLIIVSITAVSGTGATMRDRCQGVVKRNIAAMIYLKSIFNPNASYINQFTNGKLLQNEPYLFAQTINYTSILDDAMTLNKFYLFNTQIPATLQRLLNNPVTYGNKTVSIIPPTNAVYYNQIVYNYRNVVEEFDRKFQDTQNFWASSVKDLRSAFFLRLGFLCVCCALYALLLVVLHLRERSHKETLEAFFKFEREELQRKIGVIGGIIKQVQSQVSEWHLSKEFNEIIKREQISNLEFGLVKNTQQIKIKFDYSPQAQTKLEQRKYYIAVIVLALFLVLQILFIALHAVITLDALAYYQKTPDDLDHTAKLIILPNYLLADLYLPLSSTIKDSYSATVAGVLSFPVASVPGLYNLLSTAPCTDCNFMYPVLTTNYKSFYSTFEQRVMQMKSSGGPDNSQVTDLFYAADYVAKQVMMALDTANYHYVDLSIVAFVVALGVLCAAIYWGERSIRGQTDKLQLYLHFFSEEMITKNKHMNRLFSDTL